jgi:hypothetical protein
MVEIVDTGNDKEAADRKIQGLYAILLACN